MADENGRNSIDKETAAPEPKAASLKSGGGKKKKKKRGCGFFLFLILLAAGAAAGFQASGAVDLRPYVYAVVPKIPYIGEALKDLLGIPDIYAMTTDERRRIELEEWEYRIAETVRSMDVREQNLNVLSDDLSELERTLEADREEIVSRMEALSADIAERGIDLNAPPGGMMGGAGGDEAYLLETIRTFQDMSPRNAASIMERLEESLAVAILDGLPQDTRGTLLGRMDADTAARLTEQLTELQRRRSRQQRTAE